MKMLALVGRPNVGKSTLFNRFVGQRSAIVLDVPGLTRDRKYGTGELCGLEFGVIDTPGVDPFSKEPLVRAMNEQSKAAVAESDGVLFMVDAQEGITEYDRAVAEWMRSAFKKIGSRPVVVIRNKAEGKTAPHEVVSLGFCEDVAISAEHGLGMDEVYRCIAEICLPDAEDSAEAKKKVVSSEIPLKIAIVGRPNVGKSTLINAILGEDKLLTGDQSGLTRDAITQNLIFKNQQIYLIDTAGQRRKSKVDEKIEAIAVADAWKHIRRANIVVVLMDVRNPLERQDVTIARKVLEESKIVLFALNKSDLVPNPNEILKNVRERVRKEFAQQPDVACMLVSAREKKGLARVLNTAIKLHGIWTRRISTGALNKWFQMAIFQNPPPMVNGRPIKLKYISQTSCRPPTFTLFANRIDDLPTSYERYLVNHLRKSFNFSGVPLRIFLRQQENPYQNK
ncbi:MAG: ribosome biogenesis GTPase Der [Holosporaceae bacterium]|jgi:GTP-binding protein|nr:ribosome biogenesis GTPase Der [Holosporaceae bacterium]